MRDRGWWADRHIKHHEVHVPFDAEGHADPAKLCDQQEQQARPWDSFRSGYYAILGPAPLCAPGETWKAAEFAERVDQVRQMGGWSSSETSNLSHLAHKWNRRAAGADVYFNRYGNSHSPGRPTVRDRWGLKRKEVHS